MASRKRHSSCPDGPLKKAKYASKFQEKWKCQFDCITNSDQGEMFAYCRACNTNFSVSYGGKSDVIRHLSTLLHKQNSECIEGNKKLTEMFQKKTSKLEDSVNRAEVLFTYFIAEHNVPFLLADHFSYLCKIMFPNSAIAKRFSCKRTKTTHILNEAIAPDLKMEMKRNKMKTNSQNYCLLFYFKHCIVKFLEETCKNVSLVV